MGTFPQKDMWGEGMRWSPTLWPPHFGCAILLCVIGETRIFSPIKIPGQRGPSSFYVREYSGTTQLGLNERKLKIHFDQTVKYILYPLKIYKLESVTL